MDISKMFLYHPKQYFCMFWCLLPNWCELSKNKIISRCQRSTRNDNIQGQDDIAVQFLAYFYQDIGIKPQ